MSLCDSPVVLTFANSNPTLSYTSRLEHRIKELEAQLAAAKAHGHGPSDPSRTSSPSIGPSAGQSPMTDSHHFESQDEESVSESFKGLKVDDKGAITYHGSTSFFQLPSDRPSGSRDQQSTSDQAMQRRERLVANAWQQRALENMSDIPVWFFPLDPGQLAAERRFVSRAETRLGTVPISAERPLVLDPTSLQLHLQACFYPLGRPHSSCQHPQTNHLFQVTCRH